MVRLVLMLAVVIIENVYGRPPLPPPPMKDGCYLLTPELDVFSVEDEAVILSFQYFMRELEAQKMAPPSAEYLITRANGTEAATFQDDGRVQQRNNQLWLLPARASDSGEYICTYRNASYCATGSITLHVYESSLADIQKLSYPYPAMVGEDVKLKCPELSVFNKTGGQIEWYKDSSPTALKQGRAGSFRQVRGQLMIPSVKLLHAGVYTCRLRVLVNNKQYKVSRAMLLQVDDPDSEVTPTLTVPDLSMTSDPGLISGSYGAVNIRPPVIVSPLNGSVFERAHGSSLQLFCRVLTECQTADSTLVTWLVNGQSVESSYLDGRALQGGRRVTTASEGCHIEFRLDVISMTEEDEKTELKCVSENKGGRQEVVAQLQLEDTTFAWLVVAAVAASCFLTVVSIFLYALFKPKRKKKMDYFLARQNSTF